MPRWPALFRIVLCLALLVNGVSTAFAATWMQVANEQAAGQSDDPGQAVCHGDNQPDLDPEAPLQPGCCQDGFCGCACTMSAHAVLPHLAAQPPVWGAHASSPLMATGHVNAILPHLVRPPIG